MQQKFQAGDLVRVADNLGPSMEHFQKGCNAIVLGSYADQFGGDNHEVYTLFIENHGEVSWYYESQLTFVRHAPDLLESWREQREARSAQEADLKWIRENWGDVRTGVSSTSALRLLEWIGVRSSFLVNGEYFALFSEFDAYFPFIDKVFSCSNMEEVSAAFEDPKIRAVAERCFSKLL